MKFNNKNSKGFTLVEIIISIALLALIATISIVTFVNNKNDKNYEKAKEELVNAVEVISEVLKDKNNLKIYEDHENVKNSFFCFKKETIISHGIVSEDNDILTNMSDDEYIRVEKDELGNYKIKSNASKDECKYLNGTVSNDDSHEKKDGDLKEDGYQISHPVIDSDRDNENEFIYKVNFDLVTGDFIQRKMNVYTVFILDGSSSMGTSGFRSARNAAVSLSTSLINSNNQNIKNYVSGISFSGSCNNSDIDINAITQQTEFKEISLVNNDFSFAKDCTHYYEALDAGYKKIRNIEENPSEDYMYFIIFLTDGVNTGKDYNDPLQNIKDFLNNGGKEVGKLVVVGFNYSGKQEILKNISSDGCVGSVSKCFYNTSSSNVMQTFNEFYKLIQNEINCYYDKASIEIELADNFYLYKADETDPKKITKEIELVCDGNGYNDTIKKYVSNLFDGEEYIYFKKDITDETAVGSTGYKIIDNLTVNLYKKDENSNNYQQVGKSIEISGENFSKVILNVEQIEVIN